MSPEQSRRVDAALGPTSRFTAAHLEDTVATAEIKPPDEEFDEIGQDPVRHLLRPFALHE